MTSSQYLHMGKFDYTFNKGYLLCDLIFLSTLNVFWEEKMLPEGMTTTFWKMFYNLGNIVGQNCG